MTFLSATLGEGRGLGAYQRDKLQLGKNQTHRTTRGRGQNNTSCLRKKKYLAPFLLICGSKALLRRGERWHKGVNQRKQYSCTSLLASPSPSQSGCYTSPYTEQQPTPQVLPMPCKQQYLQSGSSESSDLSIRCLHFH